MGDGDGVGGTRTKAECGADEDGNGKSGSSNVPGTWRRRALMGAGEGGEEGAVTRGGEVHSGVPQWLACHWSYCYSNAKRERTHENGAGHRCASHPQVSRASLQTPLGPLSAGVKRLDSPQDHDNRSGTDERTEQSGKVVKHEQAE